MSTSSEGGSQWSEINEEFLAKTREEGWEKALSWLHQEHGQLIPRIIKKQAPGLTPDELSLAYTDTMIAVIRAFQRLDLDFIAACGIPIADAE